MSTQILKNCELWYCFLDPKRPNSKYNPENPTWEVQIRTKSKDVKKQWEDCGVQVKSKIPDEGDPFFYVNLKRRSMNRKGDAMDPVKVVNGQLKDVDSRTIGHGSMGNVMVYQYQSKKVGAKEGDMTSMLSSIQLTKHIVYTPKAGSEGRTGFDVTDTEVIGQESDGSFDADAPEFEMDDGDTAADFDDDIPF